MTQKECMKRYREKNKSKLAEKQRLSRARTRQEQKEVEALPYLAQEVAYKEARKAGMSHAEALTWVKKDISPTDYL